MHLAALAAVGCALAATPGCKPADSGSGAPPSAQRTDAAGNVDRRVVQPPLATDPLKLDMGAVSLCDPPIVAKATVTNTTSEPVTVARLMSSCACTTATIEGERTIPPGESRTVEVTVDIVGRGSKSQCVRLVGAGGILGEVRVDYEITHPVAVSVEMIAISPGAPVPPFTVARTDGAPVKVLELQPDIGAIATGPDGKPTITLDSLKAEAYAAGPAAAEAGSVIRDADGSWSSLYLVVVTDHPDCPNVSITVRRVR